MQTLLLMPHTYGADSQDIWAAAIKRGWSVERVGATRHEIELKTQGYAPIYYYGNLLHLMQCKSALPVRFAAIDPLNLTKFPHFTKRKIELVHAKDIKLPLEERAFYKCVNTKWIESRVYNAGESFEAKPDDLLYRQEVADIVDEVRCFVLDKQILTASWYRIGKKYEPMRLDDTDLLRRLESITKGLRFGASWPRGVVFDFGRLQSGEWCFIESNESYISGLYLCDPDRCLDVIVASQEYRGNAR